MTCRTAVRYAVIRRTLIGILIVIIVPSTHVKWVPYGQNQGMMPNSDPYGSHIGILAHMGPT